MRLRLGSAFWLIGFLFLLAGVALVPRFGSDLFADSNTRPVLHIPIQRGTETTYSVTAGIDGEIFPSLANYAAMQPAGDRPFGTVTVGVNNSSDSPLKARVSVEIPGWSDTEIQVAVLGAGEVQKLFFAPTFLPRLYSNREIAAATAHVTVTDPAGKVLYTDTLPVRLRSVEDMYWGPQFRFAPFIASWITPHDPAIESILARAKEFMPGRRLPGYEEWKSPEQQAAMTYTEAKAIYRALQGSGVSYVKSSLTFGRNAGVSERVRLPGDSLRQHSANCIDGVVMYASLFENLGMDPVVVLVPGHAYVGIRKAIGSDSYLYIETSITGYAPFEAAVKAATTGLARFPEKDIQRINIDDARRAGIYPMPLNAVPLNPDAHTTRVSLQDN